MTYYMDLDEEEAENLGLLRRQRSLQLPLNKLFTPWFLRNVQRYWCLFDNVRHIHNLRDPLINKTQSVIIEGIESNKIPVKSSVPQEIVLGLLLLLNYENDTMKDLSPGTKLKTLLKSKRIERQRLTCSSIFWSTNALCKSDELFKTRT